MIRIDYLVKHYGDVKAVDGLNLEAKAGEVLALLGPNGAGKSTTIKALVGLVKPDSGHITVSGLDTQRQAREARRQLGYVPQRVAFYDHLSAREVMTFFAKLRGADLKQIDPLLERVGLAEAANRRTAGFSGGMLQRLGLASALLGDPPVLVLDEPTVGLDPEGAMLFKAIVRERHAAGATVLLSSHLLGEVGAIATRVAICVKGRIVAIDDLESLRARLELPTRMTLRLSNTNGHTEALALASGARTASFADGTLHVRVADHQKSRLVRALEDDGIRIDNLRTEEATLEEIFMAYVSKKDQL